MTRARLQYIEGVPRPGLRVPGLLAAVLLLAGCAGSAARTVEPGVGQVNDPTFGLPNFAEFRTPMPIEATGVYRSYALAADARRAPLELRPGAPAAAGIDQHPSWRADFPVERQPARGHFFVSGFAAGFAARLAYGAVRGARTGSLGGGDFGASLLLGAATGLLSWGYSFRLPPASLEKRLSRDRIPSIEETAVYREWSSPPPR